MCEIDREAIEMIRPDDMRAYLLSRGWTVAIDGDGDYWCRSPRYRNLDQKVVSIETPLPKRSSNYLRDTAALLCDCSGIERRHPLEIYEDLHARAAGPGQTDTPPWDGRRIIITVIWAILAMMVGSAITMHLVTSMTIPTTLSARIEAQAMRKKWNGEKHHSYPKQTGGKNDYRGYNISSQGCRGRWVEADRLFRG